MPNRIIRDVGLTSRKLAAASDFGERLYWRVYQAVDDFGRFHADPDIIRARCFPLMLGTVTGLKVRRGRDELAALGLVEVYRVGNDEFLRITKFDQRLRAKESKFPPPDGTHMTVMRQSSAPVVGDGVVVGDVVEDVPPLPPRGGSGNGFEQFWNTYPKKRAKGDALKAWKALKPDAPLLARILQAIGSQRESPDWQKAQGRYIPYPATWLRAQRWEDVLEPSASRDELPRLEV